MGYATMPSILFYGRTLRGWILVRGVEVRDDVGLAGQVEAAIQHGWPVWASRTCWRVGYGPHQGPRRTVRRRRRAASGRSQTIFTTPSPWSLSIAEKRSERASLSIG